MSWENILRPIKFDGGKNIYAVGLSLKNGAVSRIKVYNKIYAHNDKYQTFLKNFGGQNCVDYYSNSNEWKTLYPGFSGFTVGVEIQQRSQHRYAFGFKDRGTEVVFRGFYLNFARNIIQSELYEYLPFEKVRTPKKKMKTDILEVQKAQFLSYCYCPHISHTNVLEIEDDVRFSLTERNRAVFDTIKKSAQFSILNYGLNPVEEKIYLISSEDNKDITKITDLLSFLERRNLLTSFRP